MRERTEENKRKRDVARFLNEMDDETDADGRGYDRPKKGGAKNMEFAVVTYLFLAIFLGMIAYFAYFQVVKSETFINSPYNSRQKSFAERIERGTIVSEQGDVLASSENTNGTETRSYPYGRMFAHAIGYSTNGTTGVESIANFQLLRSHAFFLEKIADELRGRKSIGDTVVTTMDTEVQRAAYDALGNYQGAVFAMQPSTGKILAMVSKPDFDPNTIAADWERITSDDSASVLLNRVTQGFYPPGSTFKLFTMLEYMNENKNYEKYAYPCDGSFTQDSNVIHCFGNTAHGQEDLKAAFANSCNAAFASIGLSLSLNKFTKLNRSLLFDSDLPCDFPYKKSVFALQKGDSTWEIMQTSIGQGETLVTPYHLALVMSAVANDGILMKPYIIDRVTNYTGTEVSANKPSEYARLLSQKQCKALMPYLKAVVTQGTASGLSGAGYTAGGKTGSAEYTSTKDSHAWFVGFASKEGKEDLVVSIVLEGAGSGGSHAVPVAKAVFDAYFR